MFESLLYILEKDDELADREDIRRERHKERQRERNLARAAPDKRYKFIDTLVESSLMSNTFFGGVW
jgi:hypothetical protein